VTEQRSRVALISGDTWQSGSDRCARFNRNWQSWS